MDRLSPTLRPGGPRAGTQRWRELLFLHWWVPVEALRPLVPARLSLDLWEGRALVGLVPFRMEGVRPGWLPAPMAQDFHETNLRTYVHLEGEGPGVYFFSLEAASWTAVQAARIGWGLPYYHATMGSSADANEHTYTTVRRGRPDARLDVRYRLGEALAPSAPGSLEFFVLERYFLYNERGGTLRRGQVHHPPYPAFAAEVSHIEEGLVAAAGLPAPGRPPDLVHYSTGVDVEVFPLHEV